MISLGQRSLFGFLLLTSLVGCSGEPAAPPAPAADAAPAPAPAPASKDPVGAERPITPK
ncbi:hypothetical protein [Singulisphaera acidiphila]|uniref:Uncharacterized protein n=1 Tax=Singulisphaera acidiphila (strain ATCC BAA-1392 / DSM 18658 / VKM B-2454 / MOB10) TaxID=886293 RepID=L0D8U9_SINAD|nr:hypothetical protein [Singulisphaera acidiphila]AGA25061.1 hypothetical protein Sinac_0646 [Singulisphaera acidiphila DSM 18658]